MGKSTWGDAKKGDVVEIDGRRWTVVKLKRKGKKAKVVVDYKGRRAETTLKLSQRVKIVDANGTKLHDPEGAQRRWATKREHDEKLTPSRGLPPGDPAQTKPPAKAKGDPWETPAGRIERKLDELLQARLVGETSDESAGYYVPPVDVSTIASHLALFHGGIPEACDDDETKMLAAHKAQHDEALRGAPLAVNHWHTAKRP